MPSLARFWIPSLPRARSVEHLLSLRETLRESHVVILLLPYIRRWELWHAIDIPSPRDWLRRLPLWHLIHVSPHHWHSTHHVVASHPTATTAAHFITHSSQPNSTIWTHTTKITLTFIHTLTSVTLLRLSHRLSDRTAGRTSRIFAFTIMTQNRSTGEAVRHSTLIVCATRHVFPQFLHLAAIGSDLALVIVVGAFGGVVQEQ
mmetsp:Transcript_331/g.778  ORF Transcript_331/g.778 Transcript_331/m.778 type:complete len:203 (+) Transcript_331:4952-5560(+)